MNILAIILILYGVMVFYITIAKPKSIWQMGKIQLFIKVLGEKRTVIFFYIFGSAALAYGIYILATLEK